MADLYEQTFYLLEAPLSRKLIGIECGIERYEVLLLISKYNVSRPDVQQIVIESMTEEDLRILREFGCREQERLRTPKDTVKEESPIKPTVAEESKRESSQESEWAGSAATLADTHPQEDEQPSIPFPALGVSSQAPFSRESPYQDYNTYLFQGRYRPQPNWLGVDEHRAEWLSQSDIASPSLVEESIRDQQFFIFMHDTLNTVKMRFVKAIELWECSIRPPYKLTDIEKQILLEFEEFLQRAKGKGRERHYNCASTEKFTEIERELHEDQRMDWILREGQFIDGVLDSYDVLEHIKQLKADRGFYWVLTYLDIYEKFCVAAMVEADEEVVKAVRNAYESFST
jgi:hypothetical protein